MKNYQKRQGNLLIIWSSIHTFTGLPWWTQPFLTLSRSGRIHYRRFLFSSAVTSTSVMILIEFGNLKCNYIHIESADHYSCLVVPAHLNLYVPKASHGDRHSKESLQFFRGGVLWLSWCLEVTLIGVNWHIMKQFTVYVFLKVVKCIPVGSYVGILVRVIMNFLHHG